MAKPLTEWLQLGVQNEGFTPQAPGSQTTRMPSIGNFVSYSILIWIPRSINQSKISKIISMQLTFSYDHGMTVYRWANAKTKQLQEIRVWVNNRQAWHPQETKPRLRQGPAFLYVTFIYIHYMYVYSLSPPLRKQRFQPNPNFLSQFLWNSSTSPSFLSDLAHVCVCQLYIYNKGVLQP